MFIRLNEIEKNYIIEGLRCYLHILDWDADDWKIDEIKQLIQKLNK